MTDSSVGTSGIEKELDRETELKKKLSKLKNQNKSLN